jgi:hypothetical protein
MKRNKKQNRKEENENKEYQPMKERREENEGGIATARATLSSDVNFAFYRN